MSTVFGRRASLKSLYRALTKQHVMPKAMCEARRLSKYSELFIIFPQMLCGHSRVWSEQQTIGHASFFTHSHRRNKNRLDCSAPRSGASLKCWNKKKDVVAGMRQVQELLVVRQQQLGKLHHSQKRPHSHRQTLYSISWWLLHTLYWIMTPPSSDHSFST